MLLNCKAPRTSPLFWGPGRTLSAGSSTAQQLMTLSTTQLTQMSHHQVSYCRGLLVFFFFALSPCCLASCPDIRVLNACCNKTRSSSTVVRLHDRLELPKSLGNAHCITIFCKTDVHACGNKCLINQLVRMPYRPELAAKAATLMARFQQTNCSWRPE